MLKNYDNSKRVKKSGLSQKFKEFEESNNPRIQRKTINWNGIGRI